MINTVRHNQVLHISGKLLVLPIKSLQIDLQYAYQMMTLIVAVFVQYFSIWIPNSSSFKGIILQQHHASNITTGKVFSHNDRRVGKISMLWVRASSFNRFHVKF